MKTVICNYCGKPSDKVTGADIYRNRSDLSTKVYWLCIQDKAYVGCHPGTEKPLGRLANAELRKAKMVAHASFDPLWKGGGMPRKAAYRFLSEKLGITESDCHIGMFDEEMCRRTVEVTRLYSRRREG